MQPFDSRQADEVATLLALAEHGSFAAAGRALQRHPSVLSKRLGALERRLGIRLVERTTRQLRFTDEGERLASRFRQAVDLLDEAEHEASLGAAQLRGRLRIALPSAMGRLWLGPLLAEFALAHPQVVLETDYSERFVDIIAEGFDLAIRVGELADSRLVATSLAPMVRVVCASPEYLREHGVPASPGELPEHAGIDWDNLSPPYAWRFQHDGKLQHLRPKRARLATNNAEAMVDAALAGLGIAHLPTWLCSEYLLRGELQALFCDEGLPAAEPTCIYALRLEREASSRTRLLLAFLRERFGFPPPWDQALQQRLGER